MKFDELIKLIKEILKGKSIIRGLSDMKIAQHVMIGEVALDLGGGIGRYKDELINKSNNSSIFVLDARKETNPNIIADLEYQLPFRNNAIDSVFLNFVVEHIFNVQQLLNEIHRILRRGGKLYMTSPFLMPIHTLKGKGFHVDDFNRFSGSALGNFLTKYDSAVIYSFEVGPFMAATAIIFYALHFTFLRIIFLMFAWTLDKFYYFLRSEKGNRSKMSYDLGYFCVAKK